jgi:hypothetical protein
LAYVVKVNGNDESKGWCAMAKTILHQNALRAIGQGLENLEVESFDLDTSDDHYVVGGECKKKPATPTAEPIRTKSLFSFIRTVGKAKATQTAGSQTFHFFGLRFTQAEADLLGQKGRGSRAKFDDCTLNPHSISQILRIAGVYLDHRESRLLKLSWHQQTLTLWHVNGLGVEAKEVFTAPDLYNLWVHQFKQRLKPTGTE